MILDMPFGVIYGLFDNTGIRYVGQTTSAIPSERFYAHRAAAQRGSQLHTHRWMRAVGIDMVRFQVLSTAETREDLDRAEVDLIFALRGIGLELTNLADGGGGKSGWAHSQETRQKIANAQTGEKGCNAKISDADALRIMELLMEGRPHTEIAKMYDLSSTAVTAIKNNTTFKHLPRPVGMAKLPKSYAKVTEEDVPRILERIAAGERLRDIGEDYNVRHTTISRIKSGHIFPTADRSVLAEYSRNTTNEQVVEIVRLKQSGMRNTDIAEVFGREPGTVTQVIYRSKKSGLWETVQREMHEDK